MVLMYISQNRNIDTCFAILILSLHRKNVFRSGVFEIRAGGSLENKEN